jgi:anaerobic dimethyl sulfoxide reductase subunit C
MNIREWTLPVYTIMTQLATGCLLVLWIVRAVAAGRYGRDELDRLIRNPILIIFVTIVAAMIGSHFHLSRPLYSFLALLNLKHSWLSREILLTIIYVFTVAGLVDLQWFVQGKYRLKTAVGWLAILIGMSTIYTMGRIYLLPTQSSWNSPHTFLSFYGSMMILGILSMAAIFLIDLNFANMRKLEGLQVRAEIVHKSLLWLAVSAVPAMALVLFSEFNHIQSLRSGDEIAQVSLTLLFRIYLPLLVLRLSFLVGGVGLFLVSVVRLYRTGIVPQALLAPVYISCLLVLVSEILGRFLFYATHVRIGI